MSLIGRIVVVVGVMMGARNEYPALYYFCLHWTIVLVCFGLAAQLRSLLKPWWGALFILVGLLLSPLLLPLFSEQIRAYLEVYFVVGLAFSLFVVVRWPESYIAEVNHQFRKVQRLREKDEFDKAKRIYERLKSKFSASEEIVAEAEEGLRKIRQIEENRLQTFESKKLYKKAMRLYGKGHW